MQILNLEMGVFGGVITPVCSYILSERFLCHSRVLGFDFALCCVVCRLRALPAEGRALCLESRVSWVESHPGQLLFPLKKGVVRVGVAFLLCTCLAPLESCVCDG